MTNKAAYGNKPPPHIEQMFGTKHGLISAPAIYETDYKTIQLPDSLYKTIQLPDSFYKLYSYHTLIPNYTVTI